MKTEQPSEWAMRTAAQLWCLPQHSSKVVDSEFVMSIARALDKAIAMGMEKAIIGYGINYPAWPPSATVSASVSHSE